MTSNDKPVRLNKYLALQLGISRREADELIEKDRVCFDGEPVPLGTPFKSNVLITVNGKPVKSDTSFVYVILNKPVGYVCSRRRQGEHPTIYELLPKELHTLKPVGRLDRESSGILLLTNDGDFAYKMTHPKFRKHKVYEITLDHDLSPLHQQMISDYGIALDDGISKFEVEKIHDDKRDSWRITMSEGRNRQIRRTFASLGYEVTTLHRISFGAYTVGALESGAYEPTPKL